ncbi:hypothetical protein V8G54_004973 [Vigna mungo]|uniref:Uncharacterized protein n=1 Tax=Vigna mungo TaxID=3915 RepID=A0AAQ3PHK2_VIGMU
MTRKRIRQNALKDEARFTSFESDQVNSVERESIHNACKEIASGTLLKCGSKANVLSDLDLQEMGHGDWLIPILFEYTLDGYAFLHYIYQVATPSVYHGFAKLLKSATAKEPTATKGGDTPSLNTEQEDGSDFNLEDKVDVEGVCNGRILRVYERRRKIGGGLAERGEDMRGVGRTVAERRGEQRHEGSRLNGGAVAEQRGEERLRKARPNGINR